MGKILFTKPHFEDLDSAEHTVFIWHRWNTLQQEVAATRDGRANTRTHILEKMLELRARERSTCQPTAFPISNDQLAEVIQPNLALSVNQGILLKKKKKKSRPLTPLSEDVRKLVIFTSAYWSSQV